MDNGTISLNEFYIIIDSSLIEFKKNEHYIVFGHDPKILNIINDFNIYYIMSPKDFSNLINDNIYYKMYTSLSIISKNNNMWTFCSGSVSNKYFTLNDLKGKFDYLKYDKETSFNYYGNLGFVISANKEDEKDIFYKNCCHLKNNYIYKNNKLSRI